MQIINSLLNKDFTKLSFKERQLIIAYFRHIVNQEFYKFKKNFLKKDKEEIFEKAYLIESFDDIRRSLKDLSFFTIIKLLKNVKENFIDYMYNEDVNNGIFDYYDELKNNIIEVVVKLPKNEKTNVA